MGVSTLIAACGKPLGTYEVRDARIVTGEAVKKVEPYIDPDPQMLRVEFISKTDLYEASDGGDLYVFASFCPFQDKKPLSVTEPYFNDRRRFHPVTHEVRRPTKDQATGNYAYTTYLRLRGKESVNRGDGRIDFTEYDLKEQQVDVCLRIEHSGYFITPSQSRVFVLPAAMIRRALSA